MTDSNPKCSYHPNRDAIAKCEMCHKLICVECKNIFRQQHSRTSHYGSGSTARRHTSYYYTQHELCTPCFYDRKIKVINSPVNKYSLIFMGGFFIMMAIVMFSINNAAFSDYPFQMPPILSIMSLVFILMALIPIGIGIRNITTAPKRTEIMKAKKKEFLNSLSSTTSNPRVPSGPQTSPYKYCPHCGDKVDVDEKICDKCGGDLLS